MEVEGQDRAGREQVVCGLWSTGSDKTELDGDKWSADYDPLEATRHWSLSQSEVYKKVTTNKALWNSRPLWNSQVFVHTRDKLLCIRWNRLMSTKAHCDCWHVHKHWSGHKTEAHTTLSSQNFAQHSTTPQWRGNHSPGTVKFPNIFPDSSLYPSCAYPAHMMLLNTKITPNVKLAINSLSLTKYSLRHVPDFWSISRDFLTAVKLYDNTRFSTRVVTL